MNCRSNYFLIYRLINGWNNLPDVKLEWKKDPKKAMAHYFIAYSNAADYNNPDGLDYAIGYEESVKAMEKATNRQIFDWEMELIKAQLHRFFWPPGSQPLEELHKKYADEMRVVYQRRMFCLPQKFYPIIVAQLICEPLKI